jgi:hypothetical protein
MSIESAAKAFARKSLPLRNYSVSFSESDYYTIDVVARDEDEAKEKAWDECNNGGYSGNNVTTEIDMVDEGDLYEDDDTAVEPADASEVAAHTV